MTKPLSPQARLILDYMMARPDRRITPLAAHTFLGVASITARIAEIRKKFGTAEHDPISDTWDTDNFKRKFKSYWMTEAQIEAVKLKMKEGA